MPDTRSSSTFTCKLCGFDHFDATYTLHGNGRDFAAVTCKRCGLFQSNYDWASVPPLGLTNDYDTALESELWGSEKEHEALEAKGRAIAEVLAREGLIEGARVLDIGCGDGSFLEACRALGASHVAGQEFRRADIEYARNKRGITDIRPIPSDDRATWPDDEFDIVCSLDVVEHVHDLDGFFRHCIRVTRPSGVLLHATPGFDSMPNRLGRALVKAGVRSFGTMLCNFTAPDDGSGGAHVSIMGRRQLEYLARKFDLDVTRAFYVSSFTYSDEHYARYLLALRWLPVSVGTGLFSIVRRTVRNKLVFIARVRK